MKLDKKGIEAIETIISRGKSAEVRPAKHGGYIVFEIMRREKANSATDIKA